MKLTDLFLAELDREAVRTRRTLEQVPSGIDDWTPHPKSMPLARLAGLVATMPTWIGYIINQDELEIAPSDGGTYQQPPTAELVTALDKNVAGARDALRGTTDDYILSTNWRLLFQGTRVMENPRHIVLRETLNHLAHHRGQLTVYLRMNNATVPAIYGPSADDTTFA
jgi:uncharacterized damage-inducible protein DinB